MTDTVEETLAELGESLETRPRESAPRLGRNGNPDGAIAAAEVIGHVGPRPLVELRNLIGDG